MAPKLSRINLGAGLKRMFSGKALAKFFIVLFMALAVLSSDIDDLMCIAHEPLEMAIIHSLQVVGWSTLWMVCGLIIVAANPRRALPCRRPGARLHVCSNRGNAPSREGAAPADPCEI